MSDEEKGGFKSEEEAQAAAEFDRGEPDPTKVLFEIQKAKEASEKAKALHTKINELQDGEYLVIDDPDVFKELRKDYDGWPMSEGWGKPIEITGRYGTWYGGPDRSIFFNNEADLRVYNLASMDRSDMSYPYSSK